MSEEENQSVPDVPAPAPTPPPTSQESWPASCLLAQRGSQFKVNWDPTWVEGYLIDPALITEFSGNLNRIIIQILLIF